MAVLGSLAGINLDIAPVSYTHLDVYKRQGMGNNPMVGASVAVAVAVEEAMKA